jgi:hypothetical protein
MEFKYILSSHQKLVQASKISKTLAKENQGKFLDRPKILQQGRVTTSKPSLAWCKASPLFFLLNKYNLGFIA